MRAVAAQYRGTRSSGQLAGSSRNGLIGLSGDLISCVSSSCARLEVGSFLAYKWTKQACRSEFGGQYQIVLTYDTVHKHRGYEGRMNHGCRNGWLTSQPTSRGAVPRIDENESPIF